MAAKPPTATPPLPPAVEALARALAELDNLTGRLAEAERAVPVLQDAAEVAARTVDEAAVAAAMGQARAEAVADRQSEARAAAERVTDARRLAAGLRAAMQRAEEAVATMADDASGALGGWTRDRIGELAADYRGHADALADLLRRAAALADAGGVTLSTSAIRLPRDLGDLMGLRHDLTPPAEPTPALSAGRDAAALIRRAQRLRDRLERGQAA